MMKSKKPAEPSTSDFASLNRRLAQLRARGRELLEAVIRLEGEKAEIVPPMPAFDVESMAVALATGTPHSLGAPSQTQGSELYRVQSERAAVEKAIVMLCEEIADANLARAQLELKRRGHEWRELLREKAMTICKLQALNRRSEIMAREIAGGTSVSLPGVFPSNKIGGTGHQPLYAAIQFQEFLSLVLRLGIITENEIATARGDTAELYQ